MLLLHCDYLNNYQEELVVGLGSRADERVVKLEVISDFCAHEFLALRARNDAHPGLLQSLGASWTADDCN